jgi:hypothetical protein
MLGKMHPWMSRAWNGGIFKNLGNSLRNVNQSASTGSLDKDTSSHDRQDNTVDISDLSQDSPRPKTQPAPIQRRLPDTGSFKPDNFVQLARPHRLEQFPLTAECSDVVVYKSSSGLNSTAIALTKSAVEEWSIILRCEKTIEENSFHFRMITDEIARVEALLDELYEGDPQINAMLLERSELITKQKAFAEKINSAEQNMALPKMQLHRDWRLTLEEIGALDLTKDEEEDTRPSQPMAMLQNTNSDTQSEQIRTSRPRTPEPTPSEIAREYCEKELKRRTFILQDRRRKLDNWGFYLEQEYISYLKAMETGACHVTQTEFDVMMLQENMDATRDLIDAEADHKEALDFARDLGIFAGSDQGSDFVDYADDGYRLSWEQENIAQVDEAGIKKWMDSHPHTPAETSDANSDSEMHDADKWDVRSVGVSEAQSTVACGKERKRIDRWRAICAETRASLPEELLSQK